MVRPSSSLTRRLVNGSTSWEPEHRYRLAIEPLNKVRYKPYLVKGFNWITNTERYAVLFCVDDGKEGKYYETAESIEAEPGFIQWLSKDWIDLEIGEINDTPREA